MRRMSPLIAEAGGFHAVIQSVLGAYAHAGPKQLCSSIRYSPFTFCLIISGKVFKYPAQYYKMPPLDCFRAPMRSMCGRAGNARPAADGCFCWSSWQRCVGKSGTASRHTGAGPGRFHGRGKAQVQLNQVLRHIPRPLHQQQVPPGGGQAVRPAVRQHPTECALRGCNPCVWAR